MWYSTFPILHTWVIYFFYVSAGSREGSSGGSRRSSARGQRSSAGSARLRPTIDDDEDAFANTQQDINGKL